MKGLRPKHLLLALLTIIIWGINFIAVHEGLKVFPPFLLCALRFGLAALPWVFFLPKPKAPFPLIMGYGIFTFTLQFGFLFSGMHLGVAPGLSSLVLQTQVFFSMGLAAVFFGDRPGAWKIIGSLISFSGIVIVAIHIDAGSTFLGLILILLAAISWAAGNMFSKKVEAHSALALVVWGNLIALPFMVATSFFIDGPVQIMSSFRHVTWPALLAVLYIVYLSTHIGYGIWGFLLKTYPTATVVPFTLLIPVIGFLSAAIFLGEGLPSWKLLASLLVLGGLVFNLVEKKKK